MAFLQAEAPPLLTDNPSDAAFQSSQHMLGCSQGIVTWEERHVSCTASCAVHQGVVSQGGERRHESACVRDATQAILCCVHPLILVPMLHPHAHLRAVWEGDEGLLCDATQALSSSSATLVSMMNTYAGGMTLFAGILYSIVAN